MTITDEDKYEYARVQIMLAIRENLMAYYKGDCVRTVSTTNEVSLHGVYESRGRYQYERREQANRDTRHLYLADYRIATLQKAPDLLTLSNTLSRSEPMRSLLGEIRPFMKMYLSGVKVSETTGEVENVNDAHDRTFFIAVAPLQTNTLTNQPTQREEVEGSISIHDHLVSQIREFQRIQPRFSDGTNTVTTPYFHSLSTDEISSAVLPDFRAVPRPSVEWMFDES